MVFQGKEVPRFKLPGRCPTCSEPRKLVRNGFFSREMIDELGVRYEMKIQRIRCRGCNASHSLLYDFLVPYKRSCRGAIEEGIKRYIEMQCTYLEAVTEPVADASGVFNHTKQFLSRLKVLLPRVMKMLLASGLRGSDCLQNGKCPNGGRARALEKREWLDVANGLLRLCPTLFEWCAANGIMLMTSGRGCELLRTHSAECMLF